MRKIFFLIAFMGSISFVYGQDMIYFTDGSKIEGKILQVDEAEVTYKKTANPDGPDYIEKKQNILLVVYANGQHETFTNHKGGLKIDTISKSFKRNYIAWTITDLVALTVSFSYEHILKRGMFGFKVPFKVNLQAQSNAAPFGLDPGESILPNGRTFGTGLDINYYPTGQGKAKYFVGPSFQFATYKYLDRDYYYIGNTYYSNNHIRLGYHYAFLINNGMLIQPTKNFNFSFFLGVGAAQNVDKTSHDKLFPKFSTGFMIGFKF
jgi:hypothetical protein